MYTKSEITVFPNRPEIFSNNSPNPPLFLRVDANTTSKSTRGFPANFALTSDLAIQLYQADEGAFKNEGGSRGRIVNLTP